MEVPFEALGCFSQVDTSRSSGRLFIGRHHQNLWETFLRQTLLEALGGLSYADIIRGSGDTFGRFGTPFYVDTIRGSGSPFLGRHYQKLWDAFFMQISLEALRDISQIDIRGSGRPFLYRHYQKLSDAFLLQTPLQALGGLSQVYTIRSSGGLSYVDTIRGSRRPFFFRHYQPFSRRRPSSRPTTTPYIRYYIYKHRLV